MFLNNVGLLCADHRSRRGNKEHGENGEDAHRTVGAAPPI